MTSFGERLARVQARIDEAAQRHGRLPGDITLLAVSKTQPVEKLREALACGQRLFGENYAQELAEKAQALTGESPQWHFIGPIQSNKTRLIAEVAHWVHSVDREKIARRLSEQRSADLPALEICLQVNVSGEQTKSGVDPGALPALADAVAGLAGLKLRGLMAIPAATDDEQAQRRAFARLRTLLEDLQHRGHPLDTLSMGMSHDLEAAIAEGATIVRVGTALFGERRTG
ncbi:YggS family pyridoxal phosphate enzyme [Thioalkalivibrio denitrificans]|uniref:Pyridoxal phosphate homeostasis protein n=1 Tax=Thioalkalivibrio denitrificans TaxID=108003 RepID=A0A1V3NV33_9GAMM|nr:YggS family pyridoxal phosphate-dependent enzyme [Thioalkalivibrio denitrificans]OOG28586.1 YggS family pyridoxal phosphate enzyme [Thioalkalivibrio denitrificans]